MCRNSDTVLHLRLTDRYAGAFGATAWLTPAPKAYHHPLSAGHRTEYGRPQWTQPRNQTIKTARAKKPSMIRPNSYWSIIVEGQRVVNRENQTLDSLFAFHLRYDSVGLRGNGPKRRDGFPADYGEDHGGEKGPNMTVLRRVSASHWVFF